MPTAKAVLQHWHGEKQPVFSLDFQNAGRVGNGRLATGGADNTVRIWKVPKEGEKIDFLATLNGHDKAVNIVRFSPNGKFLASSGDRRRRVAHRHYHRNPWWSHLDASGFFSVGTNPIDAELTQ